MRRLILVPSCWPSSPSRWSSCCSPATASEPYRVRAIFDNAGFVIPGEDVKVAGVKVGKIDSLDVTDDFKAVVVLDIDDPGYQDFRRDAECTIRPQSLIGERFVECDADAEARRPAPRSRPRWRRSTTAPGEGQHLLPVSQTTKPVDLDLINNITREPAARAAVDHPQRARHRRRRPRRRPQRRHPPRQPGAARRSTRSSRSCAEQNRTLRAPGASTATRSSQPLARERRARLRRARQLGGGGGRDGRAPRRAGGRHRAAAGASCDELRPDDGAPRRVRRPGDAGVRRPRRRGAGHQPAASASSARSREAGIPAFESLGDAAEVGTPGADGARCRSITRPAAARARTCGPSAATAAALLTRCRSSAASSASLDYIFYQVAADQRLRLVRPLPARRADRQPVLDVRDRHDPGLHGELRRGAGATAAAAGAAGPRDQTLLRDRRGAAAGAQRRAAEAAADAAGDAARRRARQRTPTPRRRRRRAPAATATPAPSPTADASGRRHARAGAERDARPAADPATAAARLPVREGPAMRGRGGAGIAGNPVLIGAATVLVVLVAVFLAYNANTGLPFVPTYSLKAEVPERGQPRARQRGPHRRLARRHRSSAIDAERARRRHEHRRALAQARARRRRRCRRTRRC